MMTISAPSSNAGICSGLMSASRLTRTGGSPAWFWRSNISASEPLASTNTPRTENLRKLSGGDAGQRQHAMHQCVGAGSAIGLRRILEFVVADAVLAGNEDHRRRHDVGEVAGVVTGAGSDAAVAVAERLGGVLDGVDQLGVEYGGRLAPDRIEGDLGLGPRA